MPAISVVVPVYKVEKFLPRCIESVLHQTFQDWELILVDDGSPDRCGAICDAYAAKDGRITVIHQKNGGLSAARNTGMKACRGEYLYFLDSDDYIAPDALEVMHHIAVHKSADIVMAGHSRVEPDGRIHSDSDHWQDSDDTTKIQLDILRNQLPNFAWGKLYKRVLWESLSFPVGVLIEDMYVVAAAFYKAQKVSVIHQPLYFYSHENAGSLMNGSGDQYIRLRYGRFLGWREHEKLARKFVPEYAEECAEKAFQAGARAYMLASGGEALSNQERKQIREYLTDHCTVSAPIGLTIGCYLISHHWEGAIALLGAVQRALVSHQQKRRQKKWEKIAHSKK